MTETKKPWTREEFEQKLRAKEKYYHINHDFHLLMNEGGLDKKAVQGWVANRFYYQTTIPIKDAAIMSNCPDRDARRKWVQRIIDHDGVKDEDGGIEAWLQLAEAVGLTREETLSYEHVLPGVKFAIDAYLNFARSATWEEAASHCVWFIDSRPLLIISPINAVEIKQIVTIAIIKRESVISAI